MPRKQSLLPAPSASAEPPLHHPDYTAAAGAAVCREIEDGLTLIAAFLCNGIAAKTGEAWLAARPDFAHEVEVARAKHLRSLIREVREAMAGSGTRHDWRASFALLERADKATIDPHPAEGESPSIALFTPAQLIDLQARRERASMAR